MALPCAKYVSSLHYNQSVKLLLPALVLLLMAPRPAWAETRPPAEATAHALDELANCYAQRRPECPTSTPTLTTTPTFTPQPTSTQTIEPTATEPPTATPTPTSEPDPADDAADEMLLVDDTPTPTPTLPPSPAAAVVPAPVQPQVEIQTVIQTVVVVVTAEVTDTPPASSAPRPSSTATSSSTPTPTPTITATPTPTLAPLVVVMAAALPTSEPVLPDAAARGRWSWAAFLGYLSAAIALVVLVVGLVVRRKVAHW